MRGAHRDVWCSKGQHLMEAELFAAERRRPAPSGRALLCAAVYAREIQGITATHKLKNARNRAPVSAEGIPSADGQKGDGKNSELTLAEKSELFYNKINTWEDFL